MQTEAPSRQGAFALVEPKNREPKLAWLELHLASEVPSQAHSDKCAGTNWVPIPGAPAHPGGELRKLESRNLWLSTTLAPSGQGDGKRVRTAGADAADFLVVEDSCSGEAIPVASSCLVRVRFAPQSIPRGRL